MGGNRLGEVEPFAAAILLSLTFAGRLGGRLSLWFGAEAVAGRRSRCLLSRVVVISTPRPDFLTAFPARTLADEHEMPLYSGYRRNAKSDRLDTVVARATYSAPVSGNLANS